MVAPFALAVGVGIALGILGAPILWILANAAACAALYMWNTRAAARPAANGDASPFAHVFGALMAYVGVILLTGLVGGGGYLLGRFFGWARLDA